MKTSATLAAGALSAIGATACCFAPLLLVTLGFGGAWLARLKGLEALQPVFVVLTVGFIGYAFHLLYLRPAACAPGKACERPAVLRRQRIALWAVVGAILLMTAFPLFAHLF